MRLEHQTVLLEEAVAALMSASITSNDSVFVDGTFGRGGHSARILDALGPDGSLVGFDKDPEAAVVAQALASADPRFHFIHDSFAAIERAGEGLAGVLLDLGVSSPQLDARERGFSFQHDGPLDMRMDTRSGMTAAEFVNTAPEDELIRILRAYGEERFARRIAAALVRERVQSPFATTGRLAAVVSEANPAWEKHKHPATRTFQAIRIHVNRELADLEILLSKVIDLLAVGGRLVVISFHSLEDRMIKTFMRDENRGKSVPRDIPIRHEDRGQRLRLIGKAIKASEAEVAGNPRARSAIMRVAERVQ
ncbi:MAG: rRNA (cytosine1402-N4)-methyltransferase [Pseudomonadota bacterium]